MNRQNRLTKLFVRLQDTTKTQNKKATKQLLKKENNSSYFIIACMAVENECKTVLEMLIEHGVDINAVNDDGDTLLHLCAASISQKTNSRIINETVELLLQNKANPNLKNKHGSTPFHIICRTYHEVIPKTLKLLLQYNAYINSIDAKGRTPLFHSAKIDNLCVVKFLLKNNADVNRADSQGTTPIVAAAQPYSFDLEVFKLLLDYKANIHTISTKQQTLLHILAEDDYFKFFQKLIDMNININAVDEKGKTALHYAADNQHEDMVKCLLNNGININILDKDNRPALHYICFHLDLIRIDHSHYRESLLNNGHQEDDEEGLSYCKYQMNWFKRIVKMMKEHIIKIKCAGFYVNDENLYYIYGGNDSDSSEEDEDEDPDLEVWPYHFEDFCLAEIKKLKVNITSQNNVTFFDLLTADIDKLIRYAHNDSIVQRLNSKTYNKKFPLYINMIRSRFAEGMRRSKLLEIAQTCFISSISNTLSTICIDKIFHYLNNDDLMKFIKTLKPTGDFDF